jgi:hypothetical protein
VREDREPGPANAHVDASERIPAGDLHSNAVHAREGSALIAGQVARHVSGLLPEPQ